MYIVSIVLLVALPGPDDILIVFASGTKLVRVAGEWFEQLADGSRVAIARSRAFKEIAEALGYKRVRDYPFISRGQPVYKKDGKYITPDVDGHRGATWKVFDRKGNRLGSYNEDLTECLGQ